MNNTKTGNTVSLNSSVLLELSLHTYTSDSIADNAYHFMKLLNNKAGFIKSGFYLYNREKTDADLNRIISLPDSDAYPDQIHHNTFRFSKKEVFTLKRSPFQETNENSTTLLVFQLPDVGILILEKQVNDQDLKREAESLQPIILQFASITAGLLKLIRLNETQNQLRETKARWQHALEANNSGVWDWHIPSGRVVFSPRWKEMLGYKPKEGENVYEAWESKVHPDDLDATLKKLHNYLVGNTDSYNHEYRLRHKQGHYIWVADHGKIAESGPDGSPARLVGTITDISYRKSIEKENATYKNKLEKLVQHRTKQLKETSEKYKAVFENIQDVYVEINKKGEILMVSPSISKYGYSPEELIGKNAQIIYADKKERSQLLEILIQQKYINGYEIDLLDAQGKRIHCVITSKVITREQHEIIISSIHDISDLKENTKKLAESEKTFRTYTESAPIGIHNIDMKGNLTYWNDAFKNIFQIPDDAKQVHYLDFIPENKRAEAQQSYLEFIKEGHNEIELNIVNMAQEFKTIVLTGRKLGDGTLLGFTQDITEKKIQEENTAIELEVAQQLSSADNLDSALARFLHTSMKLPGIDSGGIYLYEGKNLVLKTHHNLSESFVENVSFYQPHHENAKIIQKGEPVFKNKNELNGLIANKSKASEINSLGAIPLKYRGTIIGSLNVASKSFTYIPETTQKTLLKLASLLGDAISLMQQEKALYDSYKDFERLFNTIGSFLFILDKEGKILHTNKPVTDRLHYTPQELIGHPVLKVHPVARHKEAAEVVMGMIEGRCNACYVPLITKNGVEIPVETKVIPGNWRGQEALIGMSWDISELESANQSLRKSEEKLKHLNEKLEEKVLERTQKLSEKEQELSNIIANTPVGFYRVSAQGRVIMANPAMVKILGFTNEADIKEITVEDYYADFIAKKRFDELIQKQGFVKGFETRWRKKDKSIIHLIENARLIKGKNGETYYEGSVIDITEKKQLENQLLTTEATYSTLVEHAPIGILYATKDGEIQYINKHFQKLMGTQNLKKTKTLNLLTHPHLVKQNVSHYVKKALESRKPQTTEQHYQSIWGVNRYLQLTINPVPMKEGYGVMLLALDKTTEHETQKQKDLHIGLEETLLKTSARLVKTSWEKLTENIEKALGDIGKFIEADRVYIFEYHDDFNQMTNTYEWTAPGISAEKENLTNLPASMFPWWNQRIQNLKNIEIPDVEKLPEEASAEKEILQMQNIQSLVVLPVIYQNKALGFIGFDSVKAKRHFEGFDIMILRILGDLIINSKVREKAQNELSKQNTILDKKVKSRTNELEKTNEELRDQIHQRIELEKEGRLLWQAIDNSLSGVLITDADFIIQFVNGTLTELTNMSRNYLTGKSTDVFRQLRVSDEQIQEVISTITHQKPPWKNNLQVYNQGQKKIYDLLISPIYDNESRITHYVIIINDITYSKKLEQELQLNEKMAAIGTLAGSIAHEFNNVLQVVSVYRELIEISSQNKKTAEFTKEIVHATERGKSLVSSLLNYSRKSGDEMVRINLQVVVKKAMNMIRPLLKPHVNFKTDISECGDVLGFPDQLEQVIINLFTNAQKAVKTKETPEIVISLKQKASVQDNQGFREGNWAQIAVSDNGIGIAQQDQDKIFDLFYTTNEVGEGTGIGLSSIQKIVHAHQGFIFFESTLGAGTTFYVNLPLFDKK